MPSIQTIVIAALILLTHSAWSGTRLRTTEWLDGCEARDLAETLKHYPNQTLQWTSSQKTLLPLQFQNSLTVTCQPGMNGCYNISDFFIDGRFGISEDFQSPEWKKSLSFKKGNTQLSIKQLPPAVAKEVFKTVLEEGFERIDGHVYRWVEYGSGPVNHQRLPITFRITNQVICTSDTNCSVESQSLIFLPYNEMQECEVPEREQVPVS